MNNRRKLIIALGSSALSAPLAAFAQKPVVHRVGWLSNDKSVSSPFFEAFRAGMRELGYVEGRNIQFEARWGEGSNERLNQLAVELVQLKPQIIVTQGGPSTNPVIRAGATMPVVFGYSGDPVEGKIVESFARPGVNRTGMSFLSLELVGKRMEFIKEALPGLKRVAILARPQHPGEQSELHASQAAAKTLGLAIDYHQLREEPDLDVAFAALLKSRCEAIVAFPDAGMMRYGEKIAAFALKNHVPAISGWAQFADSGNLMSYGPNLRDVYRRLATFVDKILKGAKPADLPVELPTTVELVVNMKTAKALDIKIPNSILVRADRVIE
jgi:putative ABC transport system substrate-binding protein